MSFLTPLYSLFLFSTALLFWNLPWFDARLVLSIVASLIFYGSLQPQSIPLLVLGTGLTFGLGIVLSRTEAQRPHRDAWELSNADWDEFEQQWQRRRQWLLAIGLSISVIILTLFKYGLFLFPNWSDTAATSAATATATSLAKAAKSGSIWEYLIAPLGVSFFIFECMAYLVDVYRGAPASQNFLDFSAYKLFFPKLIMGPITRYHVWIEQFRHASPPTIDRVVEGLWLIASGALKKGLLADNLAVFVNLCFDNYQRAGSQDLRLAIVAYGLQLYLDFSGYVDIARGSAMLLGWTLPQNFDFPYLTTSIAEFWRRWHMTLGDWLRNYLYFPLGGSRRGLVRTCLNLTIVMFLAGLWHGSAGTGQNPAGFVVWGLLHGAALVAHRLTDTLAKQYVWMQRVWQSVPGALLGWLLTQTMVFLSWVFFRLPDLTVSTWVVQHLWDHPADAQFAVKVYDETLKLNPSIVGLFLVLITAWMAIAAFFDRGLRLRLSWPVKMMLVPLSLYLVKLLAPAESLPPIYFDF